MSTSAFVVLLETRSGRISAITWSNAARLESVPLNFGVSILVLLNGPPASGKSTVARLWVDGRPLALNLDLDDLWLHLGRWQDDLTATGLAARDIALAMCQAQLTAGRDVIIPQFLGRDGFIDQLAAVGGGEFRHLILLPPLAVVRQRFADRGAHPIADHPDASTMAGDLDQMYARLVALARDREDAELIELTGDEQPADVAAQIGAILRNGPFPR